MALKINPQSYNWPQKTCTLLKNKFPGSNWRVIFTRIKQSEVFDKVLVTEFCVFLTRRQPASRAFSHGTYALYREKALHESCQVPVEHAQSVAKIHFRTQA